MPYTLKVISIIKETDDAKTFCFKQPALKKVNYLPGQYITLTVNINNRKYKRPYSLSSATAVDNTLNVTVKRIQHGVVSNHLIDVVKEDDILEVMQPMGSFTYDHNTAIVKEVCLWGAGSGVTPLMSILKTILHLGTENVVLSYVNKSLTKTIFLDQLLKYQEQYPGRFSLKLYCTEEKSHLCRQGRIDEFEIGNTLSELKDVKNTAHYICGPTGLKETVKAILVNRGVSQRQIFSEDFEHVVDQEQLKEIQTRFVEIKKGNEFFKVEVVKGKSILEAGLDQQIDLPYSCQTGSCTLCKAKILSGLVKKIGVENPDEELQHNEHLLCCSYPLTENVIFEI